MTTRPHSGADAAALAAHVERAFESDVVPALSDYTSLACLSPAFDASWEQAGHLVRAAELIAGWCSGRTIPGAEVEVVALPGRTPLVLGEIPPSDPGRSDTTVVYGHFDKQPPLGDWAEGLAPFEAVRRGDRLYGRGTADDGYAAFAAFTAVEALAATGRPHGRIVVLIEGSEESGSPDLDAYLELLAGRIGTPSLVVCLDSGAESYDRLWLTASLRGTLVALLRVDVLEEGAHSGAVGGVVPSSFRILRQLLERIEDGTTGSIRLPELHQDVPPERAAEIDRLVEVLGDAPPHARPVEGLRLTGETPAERVRLRTWEPCLEVTGLAGAPAPPDAGNVLRPFTEAKLSLRLPPGVDAASAAQAVRQALTADPPSGARVSLQLGAADGFEAPPLRPSLQRALDAASLAHFANPLGVLGEGGSIPFLAALKSRFPGTQFVVTGVLGPESNAHGPNEFLHLPTARAVTACVAEALAAAP